MANEEHLARLKQGVEAWNQWRDEHPEIRPDFREANLQDAELSEANLQDAELSEANLQDAELSEANLTDANLTRADLTRADLTEAGLFGAILIDANLAEAGLAEANLLNANLTRANLREAELCGAILINANLAAADLTRADLTEARLYGANLIDANLAAADLTRAMLVEAKLDGVNLTGSRVYGIAAWNVCLAGAQQSDLIITDDHEPVITVDNLEVAQFIYLLLHNEKIREVIDTITSKAVLILGRFTPERKAVLDAIREELRRRNYLPIVFDFERPTDRDFTETIMTLAGMCLFIIADITNPKSSPLELQATIPNYMVPFVPIIHEGEQPFSMFRDLKNKHPECVLDVIAYDSASTLVRKLGNAVIRPALKKHDELLVKKVQELQIRHVKDYPDDEELV